MKLNHLAIGILASAALAACGPVNQEGTVSEVATSAVSGAINSGSTSVGLNTRPEHKSPVRRLLEEISPIGTAWAATWSCSGSGLTPTFNGAGTYQWTPISCSVTWANGKSASSQWSGPFTLVYNASCNSSSPLLATQAASCAVTRTTGSGGVTRTITGPNGGVYDITHDTNGQGTGWDSSVSPAPANGGVVWGCSAGGCTTKNLVINGSHLTGNMTPAGGSLEKVWDHTVSTDATGLTVTGDAGNRSVSGSVTVQHNILKYTAKATFNQVTFADVGCCFPTSGTVSSVFSNGTNQGKTETLSFSATCGEATLTTAAGKTVALTLQHCL